MEGTLPGNNSLYKAIFFGLVLFFQGRCKMTVLKDCALFPCADPFFLMPINKEVAHFLRVTVGEDADKTYFIHTMCSSMGYHLRKSENYLRANFVIAIRCQR